MRIPLAALLTLAALETHAQAPDTSRAKTEGADSTHLRGARVPAAPLLETDLYREGIEADTTPLVKVWAHDVVELLDALPGSFRYTMGNLGWPDQLAYRGLAPRDFALTLDGIPMQDPVTGRPLFEVLPMDLLRSPAVFLGRHSAGAGIEMTTRRFDVERPLTELRYRAGKPGLQSISATHVQQRRIEFLGSPTRLQILFRYAGGGWDGSYPDSFSDLSQVYGRVGFFTAAWALRITNLHTRRSGGAHGGVLVRSGGDFDSVYTPFNAAVADPKATFRIERNDFNVAFDRRLIEGAPPLSLQFSWVSHLRRYRNVSAPEARIHEYTLAAAQSIPGILRNGTVRARLISRFDDVRSATVFRDSTVESRANLEALIESSSRVGNVTLAGHLGMVNATDHAFPEIHARASWPLIGLGAAADLSISGRAPSRIEVSGSQHITPVSSGSVVTEHTRLITLSAQRSLRSTQMTLEAFAASTGDPLEVWEVSPDSFRVRQGSSTMTWFGLTGVLDWHRAAPTGFYGALHTTVQTSSAETGDAFEGAIDGSIPKLQALARIGARSVLFQNDLHLDVYAVGRYWSSFESRVYDPVTGVLALPSDGSRTIGNSGTLDLRAEAGIRSATIYVGFENVLAGVSYPGTMLVPVYPLAGRAFRFGVFWPIEN